MTRDILSLDVGTSALKLGVFTPSLEQKCEALRQYEVNVYDQGKADIEPEKWWEALRDACAEIGEHLASVGVVSLSVTTPGLTPMAADGTALGPAILFFDGRSHEQARAIRALVGEETFLRETCNLPVSGGSSLCSMLWIRDHQPRVFASVAKFGHCNTYLAKRLTGRWAIDPSTVSITGLYNTAANDLTWNRTVLEAAGIAEEQLPPLMHSYDIVGDVLPVVSRELDLPRDCVVLCGGNDAVLAAHSGGRTGPGTIHNVCGTCEITSVFLDRPIASPDFNVRCDVLPGRWMTFFVLNTGGKALEWFHATMCREMSASEFYEQYVPSVLSRFFDGDPDAREAGLPVYTPFLGGSRYTLEQVKASFSGVTLETTREDLLLAVVRGNAAYHGSHLEAMGRMVQLGDALVLTGRPAGIRGYVDAKRRWSGDFHYEYRQQSSLRGAAMLAGMCQSSWR